MSDFLEPGDLREAGLWFARQTTSVARGAPSRPVGRRRTARPAAIHLLVGDSIGQDAGLVSRFQHDVVVNRCPRGATAGIILDQLELDMRHWEMRAETEQLPMGTAVYWITANDVYSRYTGCGSISPEELEICGILIRKTIKRLLTRTNRVLILGPLPRPDGDLPGLAWEKTAAYHLERTAKRVVEDMLERREGEHLKFVPLGRCLTKKQGGRHSVRIECAQWYREDGVHLNAAGYEKLGDAMHLPVWLRFA